MSFEESAKRFRKAMKGLGNFIFLESLLLYLFICFCLKGTDEDAIIKEVCSNACAERQEVKKVYLSLYGHVNEKNI